jgi:processive rubber oxygenase RoxA-like protein
MSRAVVVLLVGLVTVGEPSGQRESVPKTWDEAALHALEVPAPDPAYTPKAVSVDYFYRIPVRPIYRGYPVYAPGREPSGYFDSLLRREPEVVWDEAAGISPRLETEADWIAAGEVAFDAPIFYDGVTTVEHVRDPNWYKAVGAQITKDGVLPYATYVVREKGKVELANNACAFCHTRLLADGRVVKGAQGNFEFDRANAYGDRRRTVEDLRLGFRTLFGAPWLKDHDPAARVDAMSREEIIGRFEAIPAGVAARHRSSIDFPPAIPDLIGIRDRKYLDRTGLVRHRDIGDVMRYAALNNELDFYSNFGGFNPAGKDFRDLPEPTDPDINGRYSDTQLYALSKFLYALKPPDNPNRPDALSKQGEVVFQRTGCGSCHTPPLYTNNALVPADGFTPPPEHFKQYDVMRASIGTDPTLTLHTRRGTGYYKVPSLRGVWYRGPFEHNGSVATLEDWLDAKRVRDDYVPTGFRGYRVKTRAVKGHPFGLSLSVIDKAALIAFLKTL